MGRRNWGRVRGAHFGYAQRPGDEEEELGQGAGCKGIKSNYLFLPAPCPLLPCLFLLVSLPPAFTRQLGVVRVVVCLLKKQSVCRLIQLLTVHNQPLILLIDTPNQE